MTTTLTAALGCICCPLCRRPVVWRSARGQRGPKGWYCEQRQDADQEKEQ